MTTNSLTWYQTLGPHKRKVIQDLHRIKPTWNLVALVFVAAWFVVGGIVTSFPYWFVRLPGYILIGLLIHGMANFMHEAIHGNLFGKSTKWNRWFGFIMGVPSLFSMTAYRVVHLLHHKHNRTQDDPDEFKNVTTNKAILSILFYLWLFMGMLVYLFHVPLTAFAKGKRKDRVAMGIEYGILLACYGTLLYLAVKFDFFPTVLHCWFIPLLVGSFFGNIRGWAEHMLTFPGHPLTETRTVKSNRAFSFLNINLNYHLEHHLFPGIPWYNLPKLHELLIDDYQSAGASIYHSYFRFLFDAFRAGVHKVVPA
jgi:fatty acid desaturase